MATLKKVVTWLQIALFVLIVVIVLAQVINAKDDITRILTLKDIQPAQQNVQFIRNLQHNYRTVNFLKMLTILQVNIRCLATSKRLLENYVDKHKVDIVVLSETWNRENCIKFKN